MDFFSNALKSATGSKPSNSSSAPVNQAKPDQLDKAIDLVQEHVLKSGSQKNETAEEQAKDSKIKMGITSLYKKATGKDIPGTK
ncbi:hypothetical protein FA15DRAFT_665241 [Coprinopsis marcescibilis]|uniref:Uncharacterized protein n=1 Tax=Coprinopsis marcescibilis TaxID=230819 RepID=A0A5C3L719_COPMA|nr:hypothetical protein FA15DRAFT_665241 [Coprinopsis marcescibilis]